MCFYLKNCNSGNSLAVQWLGLSASPGGDTNLTPGWGTRIPEAMWHGHINSSYNSKKSIIILTHNTYIVHLFSVNNHIIFSLSSDNSNKAFPCSPNGSLITNAFPVSVLRVGVKLKDT